MGAMDQDILKVLYSEKEIAARVKKMGEQMYEDLWDKDPLFVSVLRGAFIFMADIVRACEGRCGVYRRLVLRQRYVLLRRGADHQGHPAGHLRAEPGGY